MRFAICLTLLALLVPSGALHAEKVDTPPAAMRKHATHVVVATVKAIYTRQEREGGWAVTRYLAEVEVKESEKGPAKAGQLLYVRYWHRRWRGPGAPPPSTSGHRGLPKEGETLRIHAVGEGYNGFGKTTDGGLDVFGANGFQRLDEDESADR